MAVLPLDGALAFTRTSSAVVAPGATPVPATPASAPAAGSGDDVSASWPAQIAALVLLAVGVVIALVMKENKAQFKPADGFALFTGFYIAAQAIERGLELLPSGSGTKQAKANRVVIFASVGFIAAVILAEVLGLYYLRAVGATSVNGNLDVIFTALAIGGGTKPLHDGIKRIEKAKETPPATT